MRDYLLSAVLTVVVSEVEVAVEPWGEYTLKVQDQRRVY
jgi:hypothetical protein